jgi:sugar transferase (PEP-CTERM system associated)
MLHLLKNHYPFRSFVFILGEGGAILLALVAGMVLRLSSGASQTIIHEPYLFILRAGVVIVVCQSVLFLNDLYEFQPDGTPLGLLIKIIKSLGVSAIILAFIYYLVPALILGRGVFALAMAIMAGVIFGWRLLYFWVINSTPRGRKMLLVGADKLAVDIAREVLCRKDAGVQVIGFLTDDDARVGEQLLNPCIIGTYDEVSRIVEDHKVDQVVVALRERRGFPVDQLLGCKMKGVSIVDGVRFFEQLTGKLMVESMKPSNLIYSDGFKDNATTRFAKRAMDFVLAGAMLCVCAPLMAIIAALIKLDSAGPVFFRQERLGARGRIIKVNKFRSMRVDAESLSGPVWASDDDPRVTRVGRWLRKFRLDELPQLWNVLQAEMSLVGPRPERPFFVEQLKAVIPYYDQRITVKPGITGWAQVRYSYGSSEEDALEKLKYDLYYVKHYTVGLDLLILFETIRIVFFGRGSK